MKKFIGLFVVLASIPSFADVQVLSAVYNRSTQKIEAQLQFGGCGAPAFKLKFDSGCYETLPPQADADVIQTAGDDGCERLNQRTVSLSLQGDSCFAYGKHFVNLKGSNRSNSIRVTITR